MVDKALIDLTHRFSKMVGRIADVPVPTVVRDPLWSVVGRALGVDVRSTRDGLDTFETFGSFFGRALKENARPVADEALAVVPCDGLCVAAGRLASDEQTVRVKGHTYTVGALLGMNPAEVSRGTLYYWVIYLAPRDYHRVHAPVSGSLHSVRHVPGTLFPVNALGVRFVPALFTRNERVVFSGAQHDGSPWALSMVGALGVGSIAVNAKVAKNLCVSGQDGARSAVVNHEIRKGSEIGAFKLGSTVILGLVSDAQLSSKVRVGSVCRMGEPLFDN